MMRSMMWSFRNGRKGRIGCDRALASARVIYRSWEAKIFKKEKKAYIRQYTEMATSVQENLVQKNDDYASKFSDGNLAIPPAKQYAVG